MINLFFRNSFLNENKIKWKKFALFFVFKYLFHCTYFPKCELYVFLFIPDNE